MKYLFTLLFTIALFTAANAQSRTGTVEYQKINRQAVIAELPFPEKTIRDAIEDTMQKMGYKGKDSKGYTVYKGVHLPALGNDLYDLYFLADRKSRKDKESSTLTLMITKGYDSFVSDSSDSRVINNAKDYMDSIRNTIAAYDLEQQIVAQEDAVKKADKKFTGLVDDAANLEKKKKNLEKDIEDNKKDQASQQAEIVKQKQILDTLRGKRRS
ncbi:hypothetical protein [Ferruginibacter sp.]